METIDSRQVLQIFVVTVLVTGCSTLDILRKPTHEERVSVMGLWNLYKRCVSTALVDEKVAAADRLTEAVGILIERTRSISLLPATIERMLSWQPNRLAVDPRAMAAACSLSAGLTLSSRGNYDAAANIFRSILLGYQEPQYAYYAAYARNQLVRLAQQIQPTRVSGPHPARANDHDRGELPFIR